MKNKIKEYLPFLVVSLVFFMFGLMVGGARSGAQISQRSMGVYHAHEVAEISLIPVAAVFASFGLGCTILIKTKFRKVVF